MLKRENVYSKIVDCDILADLMNHNCDVLMQKTNENTADILDMMKVLTKVSKKTRHKASKLSVLMVAAAGVAYIVKNERDKREMNQKLIESKTTVYKYESTEDEGEATDPQFI